MKRDDEIYRALDVNERIVRRFAEERFPVALKGSYLHSTAYPDPLARKVLSDGPDFVVLKRVPVARSSKGVDFDALVDRFDLRAVLESALDVLAEEYPELTAREMEPLLNRFDEKELFVEVDFVTARFATNVGGDSYRFDFALDQKLIEEPEAFEYRPRVGEPFVVPYAEPIATQVAGKLHQTLLRVRTKDPIDLWRVMPTVDWSDPAILTNCLRSIVADCDFFPEADALLADLVSILDGERSVVERLYSRSRRRGFVKKLPNYAPLILEPDEPFDPSDYVSIERLEALVWERFIAAASGSLGRADWRPVLSAILAER